MTNNDPQEIPNNPSMPPIEGVLHDHDENVDEVVDTYEFPDGNVKLVCHDVRQRTAWATETYKSRSTKFGTRIHKKCLGVFVCSEEDCGFVTRPQYCRNARPVPTSAKCSVHHHAELQYLPCNVKIVLDIIDEKKCVEIKNHGKHNHPRPPKIRPSPLAMDKFETIVKTAQEATPLTLSVGTDTRPPVGTIDSAFRNLDRVRRHTHK
mmetsp:Transcript_3867/g.8952  ORF Transcript_3867/g.8952 Transcript_3867/m.8952 type:complete len:207 (+) Transcript_3867:517-1137(+)